MERESRGKEREGRGRRMRRGGSGGREAINSRGQFNLA